MLKRHHRFFQSLQIIRDALIVGVAFILAYCIRFTFSPATFSNTYNSYFIGLGAFFLWPIVAVICGLYRSQRAHSQFSEIFDVLKVCSISLMFLVTSTYFIYESRYSRGVLLLWSILSFMGVASARMLARYALQQLRARGYNLRHIVIIGAGPLAERVLHIIEQQATLGFRVTGIVVHERDKHLLNQSVHSVPVLGVIGQLPKLFKKYSVDQVIVALPLEQLGTLKRLMQILSRETVDVRLLPDVHQYMTLCGSIEEFSGLPMINLQSSPLLGWNLVGKRLFDIVASALLILLFSPLLIFVALCIFLTDGRPIFFGQVRVGLDGRQFFMYKFRSMKTNSEALGAQMTAENDPRRTRLGSFLRRYSIDELPQLLNVLKGDMSLVGPRPEQPRFIEDFKREIPRYALRHKMKAGMTGWAQVNGLRGNTSIQDRIELDLYYIENWSILLDIKILLRTFFGGFMSPHAY